MTYADARSLAAHVLNRARHDMQRGHPDAIAWLGSSRATKWLEIWEIHQSHYLVTVGWPRFAAEMLRDGLGDETERDCVRQSLDYIEHLRRNLAS